ncbi:MAG: HDOD domain-containing protein, partial [Rhodocyclaceae bacterium]|nr:HDOD domain-containing protein [Rhodocyclaceae bacterium]
ERQAFGMDHAAIGGVLAEQWRLPAPIPLALRDHHGPAGMSDAPLVVLTHFAESICQSVGRGTQPLHALSPLIDSVLKPDWAHLPYLFGEIEAMARLTKAVVRAPKA